MDKLLNQLESGFMLIIMFYALLAGTLGLILLVIFRLTTKPFGHIQKIQSKQKKPNKLLRLVFLPIWLIIEFIRFVKHALKTSFFKLPYRIRQVIFIIVVLTITVLSVQTIFKPKTTDAAWYNDYWGYRKAITLTVSSSSSDITSLETLLTIDTTGFTSKLQSNCEDLRFTNQNGDLLPYYIDTCTDNSASNKVWVLVDLVPKNTTTYTLYMYYGNPSAISASNSELFFRLRGLVGYWTSNETSWNGTAGEVKDSSANGNNGVRSGNATTTSSGQYSYAGDYDGTGDFVSVSSFDETVTEATITAWIFVDAMSSYDGLVFSRGTNVTGMNINTAGTGLGYHWNDANNTYTWASGLTISTGSWAFVAIAVNASEANAYLGQGGTLSSATNTVSHASTQLNDLKFATDDAGSRDLDGRIDDVRIYNRTLSSSEITSLYNDPGTIATTATATSQPSTSFASEEQSPGPVAWWKFDDGTGTAAKDSSQNGNTGTLSGTTVPAWKTQDLCEGNMCLYFDGDTSYISVPNSDSLNVQTGNLTLSAWINRTGNSTAVGADQSQTIIAKGNGASTYTYTMFLDSSQKVNFSLYDGTNNPGVTSNTTIQNDQWYHLEGTYDGTNLNLYINGVLDKSGGRGSYTTASSNSDTVLMGRWPNDTGRGWFNGFVDEPKIYNYARSQNQIRLDYNAGLGADETPKGANVLGASQFQNEQILSNGQLGYWKLDESSGDASDSSGNGLTLTNNGTTTYVNGKFYRGSEHVPASSQYLSTATTISDVKSVSFWTNPDSTSNYFISLTSGAYITATSGTISATGFTSPKIYVNGVESTTLVADVWQLVTVTTETDIDANQFYVGRQNTNYYDGTMDEVRLYSEALDASIVSLLYAFGPGPVAYWNFENGSGDALDVSGSENTLTNTNSATYNIGKYGKAGNLEASSTQYFTRADTASLSSGDTSLTWSAWAYHETVNLDQPMIYKSNSAVTTLEYAQRLTGGSYYTCYLKESSGGTVESVNASTFGVPAVRTWNYVSCVYNADSDSLSVYVNGILDQTTTGVTGPADTTADLFLGQIASVDYYNGRVDEAKIYKYARSAKQIVEDMNAGHPAPGSPVGSSVGYWKFDEGYGTTAYDTSQFGNNGSMSNFASPATSTSGWSNAGKFTKALNYDGANDVVDAGSRPALDNMPQLTASAWIYPRSYGENSAAKIFVKAADSDASNGWVFGYGSTLSLLVNFNSELLFCTTSTTPIAFDTWSHVVVTWNGDLGCNNVNFYINGIKQTTTVVLNGSGTRVSDAAQNLIIGNTPAGDRTFDGFIDEAQLYNSALTEAEIKVNYNKSQALVLGALGNNSNFQNQASGQQYCVPGDTSTCTGPVLEMKFETGSGATAYDTSGNGYTGAFTGTTWGEGKYGKGSNHDGNDDYMTITDNTNLDIGTSDATIEVWMKSTTAQGFLIFKRSAAETQGYTIYANGTNIRFQIGDGTTVISDTPANIPVNDGQWHHVVMVIDRTNDVGQIWIDGVQDGANIDISAVTGSLATTTNFITGRDGGTGSDDYTGQMDEIRLFLYARSPAQIAYDYNRGLPLIHQKLDECQGTTTYDSSGNNYNGTITGTVGTCTTSATTMRYDGRNGKYNYSLDFDGNDDYSAFDNDSLTNFGDYSSSTGYTLASWAKTTSSGTNGVIFWGSSSSGTPLLGMSIQSGFLRSEYRTDNAAEINGGSALFSLSTVNDGNWHHVAVSRNGNVFKIYVDGRLEKTHTDSASFNTLTANQQTIGALRRTSGAENDFDGQIDDVKIFNYPLTDYQVKVLYNQNAAVQWVPISGAPQ